MVGAAMGLERRPAASGCVHLERKRLHLESREAVAIGAGVKVARGLGDPPYDDLARAVGEAPEPPGKVCFETLLPFAERGLRERPPLEAFRPPRKRGKRGTVALDRKERQRRRDCRRENEDQTAGHGVLAMNRARDRAAIEATTAAKQRTPIHSCAQGGNSTSLASGKKRATVRITFPAITATIASKHKTTVCRQPKSRAAA